MQKRTIQKAGIFAFFWGLSVIGHAQNPILRSTTTGVPTSLTQITSSLLTQKSDFVGIGTTSPTQRLTLKWFLKENAVHGGGAPTYSNEPPVIRFEHLPLAGTDQYWHLSGGSTFDLSYMNSNITPLSVKNTGEVFFMDKANLSTQTISSTNDNRLGLYVDNTVRRIFWTSYASSTNNTSLPFEFMYDAQGAGSTDVSVMKLMPSGQVRIGNANTVYQNFVPGAAANTDNSVRLLVNGNVAAKGFIATQQNWADFVFYAPEGNPTLLQEEASIRNNCTLVGVPTESEAALGRNLADNDALLLQKLEQLYLHVIALNKKVDMLQQENDALKAGLNQK